MSTSSHGGDLASRLRALPGVDRLISALNLVDVESPPPLVADAARRAVERARERVRQGAPAPAIEELVAEARGLVETFHRSQLHPVINATGVLIHTNLGRVPLGQAQLDAVARVAGSYSNLEYDVEGGRRGTRYAHARALLTALTGAESALVVNNNAAAVLIVLAALCKGREVIISRGELIEIGGEFRIPDVMAASGAHLVEVGTTNRTHLADYERAISENSAAILKVHPSNYRLVGFTASVPASDLARLARGRGLRFIHDVGSGLTSPPAEPGWIRSEPLVEAALEDGADVVTCSGDKLLGGPQAGLILGRSASIAEVSRHPLLRALRVDKMTLAALEATLEAYLRGSAGELPLWQMALADLGVLERRARAIAAEIGARLGTEGVKAEAIPVGAVTGGGSLPGTELSSWAVAVGHPERSAAALEGALRRLDPPVVGRIEADRVLLDVRTISERHDELLTSLVAAALGE
jgi:L-seryl-tRNA(Ser) seleniumtransferase